MADVDDWTTPVDDWETPQQGVGSLQAAAMGANQGMTFGFGDEMGALEAARPKYVPAKVGPIPTGAIAGAGNLAYEYLAGKHEAAGRYEEELDRIRKEIEIAKAQHPWAYGAGEVAGAIPATFAVPEAGLVKGSGLLAQTGRAAIQGAGYGALQGAGEGESLRSRAEGALAGGVGGGLVGGALGGAGSFIADRFAPVVGIVRGAKDPMGEAALRVTTALDADEKMIAAGTAKGMTAQEWAAAKAAGEPVTLADLGAGNTQALLRSAANLSPEARAQLEHAFEVRFLGQSERAANTLRGVNTPSPQNQAIINGKPYHLNPNGTLGPPVTTLVANAHKTAEDLVAAYDAGRVPLYRKAFNEGDREIMTPTMERLTGSPTFVRAMQGAVKSGQDRAVTEGLGAFNPGVTVENGVIRFNRGPNGVPQYPNLQYWDAVKRELDDMASSAGRSGEKGQASVIGNMAKTLRGELDKEVPSYASARGYAAKFMGANNALEAGQQLAGKIVDPDTVRKMWAKMAPDERDLFREGYASDWANRVIGRMRDTRDITKAMFNSPNEREMARIIFGEPGLNRIQARMTLETIMQGAYKALGNSTTAQQLIAAGLAGGTLEGYMSGWDPTKMAGAATAAGLAHKFVVPQIAASARKLVGRVDSATANEVARLLTSNDPTQLNKGLRLAVGNQRIMDGLRRVANTVGAAAGAVSGGHAARLYVPSLESGIGVSPEQKQNQP